MRSRGVIVMVMGLALGAGGCTTNPATGKKNLNFISPQQELALGMQAEPQFLQQYGGEIPSTPILNYVSDLGHKLAAVSERPTLPWEFHVVDSTVINAFALPGGKIFITRGLLSKLENEAQLAGVLGHEIGHVNAQHINQQMSQQMVVQGISTGLGAASEASDNQYLKVLGVGTQVGGTVYLLKFSRDQESQADELGVRYMTKLGYNPIAQVQVMEILKREAGGGGGLEILQTHPLPETRIERLTAMIKEKYPDYNQPGRYKINADVFQAKVLKVLPSLPPAKNTGEQQGANKSGQQFRGKR